MALGHATRHLVDRSAVADVADLRLRAELVGDPLPGPMRRLMGSVMEHQAGQLQDDASIVMVEWRTGSEGQLRL